VKPPVATYAHEVQSLESQKKDLFFENSPHPKKLQLNFDLQIQTLLILNDVARKGKFIASHSNHHHVGKNTDHRKTIFK